MTAEMQTLSPRILGFWVRCIRAASKWSQEALAEASGLNLRTIPRIEAGQAASVAPHRSLARGLGYENLDVFDDPPFVAEAHKLLETVSDHGEKARFPDHLKLLAEPVRTGDALGRLIGASSAYVFNCDDELSDEVKEHAAMLFDLLQDYGDVWSDLTHGDRLSASRSFDENLAEFEQLGARLYSATRATNIVGSMWTDKTPIPITIGYVTLVPNTRDIGHIMVPKGV
jgi:transcriptional regulator with XRE-family HTH domain